MFGLILTGLAIDRFVHQLEELFFHLGLGGGTEICVLPDVWLQPARLLELDDAVYISQLQPMLDVEFEVQIVGDIVDLIEETGGVSHPSVADPSSSAWQPPPASHSGHWASLRLSLVRGDSRCVNL